MIRISILALLVVGSIVTLCTAALSATEYVISNENSLGSSSLVLLKLDTVTGVLSTVATLPTGGRGFGPNSNGEADVWQAVSPNADCIFAMDVASSDIAAFQKASHYARIGNYSNPALNSDLLGGAISLSPSGNFLYASYTQTEDIGIWAVNPDCSLTFVAAYSPVVVISGPLKVTPDGRYLLITRGFLADLISIDPSTGELTNVGVVSFQNICPSSCMLSSFDFTRDSRIVVFMGSTQYGDQYYPIALAAEIAPTGLTNLRGWRLNNSAGVGTDGVFNSPFFSAAGYAGSGNLYFGVGNGVITTNFTEKPLRISLTNATFVSASRYDGLIAATGSFMIVAEAPNQIGVFTINPDGSLTELSTTTIDNPNAGMFSLSLFPNTR